MRIKLFLIIALLCSLPILAQSGVRGVVVDSESSLPVAGASVILERQNLLVVTGADGSLLISNATPGESNLTIVSYGYKDWSSTIDVKNKVVEDLGIIKLNPDGVFSDINNMSEEFLVSESLLEDEEGNSQAVGALTGASDNIYYQATRYAFSAMRFRFRGYDQQ